MFQIKIKTAGITFSAEVFFISTVDFCKKYVSDDPAAFHVTVTREELKYEQELFDRLAASKGCESETVCGATLEVTALHRLVSNEMLKRNILLFHGSAVAVDGEVYIFATPSGTGKSTHAKLWREYLGEKVIMVNDDKPYLYMKNNRIMACGSPWDGKHRLSTDIELPVKAICILERGSENEIHEIDPMDAFPVLFRQCFHAEEAELEEYVLEVNGKD